MKRISPLALELMSKCWQGVLITSKSASFRIERLAESKSWAADMMDFALGTIKMTWHRLFRSWLLIHITLQYCWGVQVLEKKADG